MAEFTAANIEQQLSQLNLNESPLEIPAAASPQQHPAWRQSVTPGLRIHLADKLLETLGSRDQAKFHFTEHARKAEAAAFEAAKSRSEYYRLIAVEIYKIQKEQRAGDEQPCCWRGSVAVELRWHIVDKLIQTIVPGCDVETVDEQNSMRNLLEYAEKVENEVFEAATSRCEYYKLIAEKIFVMRRGAADEEGMEDC